ncbi:hypothetical protein BJ875DRAFT_513960 [Amylocarpus encephaloides]|uniref:Uncharacterized protein n=1 Tax=Amylocarpus encephaloides TaxID=45428 RepID=A0A9P7YR77_9HELO|nr:hypothetical protein BJ875DRAFT_513960 [Amylocarpus encephaloides]
MALVCLRQLCVSEFNVAQEFLNISISEVEAKLGMVRDGPRKDKVEFFEYALDYWWSHLVTVETPVPLDILEALDTFSSGQSYAYWRESCVMEIGWYDYRKVFEAAKKVQQWIQASGGSPISSSATLPQIKCANLLAKFSGFFKNSQVSPEASYQGVFESLDRMRKYKTQAELHSRLGHFHLHNGDIATAQAHFKEAIKIYPEKSGTLLLKFHSDYLRTKFYDPDPRSMRQESKIIDDLLEREKSRSSHTSKYLEALTQLGLAQFYNMEFTKAQTTFEEASSGLEPIKSSPDLFLCSKLYLGFVYEQQRKLDLAARVYEYVSSTWAEIVKPDDTNPAVSMSRSALASIQFKRGYVEDSITTYRDVLQRRRARGGLSSGFAIQDVALALSYVQHISKSPRIDEENIMYFHILKRHYLSNRDNNKTGVELWHLLQNVFGASRYFREVLWIMLSLWEISGHDLPREQSEAICTYLVVAALGDATTGIDFIMERLSTIREGGLEALDSSDGMLGAKGVSWRGEVRMGFRVLTGGPAADIPLRESVISANRKTLA